MSDVAAKVLPTPDDAMMAKYLSDPVALGRVLRNHKEVTARLQDKLDACIAMVNKNFTAVDASVTKYVDAANESMLGVKARLAAVEEQLATLKSVGYKGTWQPGETYAEGNLVTQGGALWHANRSTSDKPGTSNTWTLCVKSHTR